MTIIRLKEVREITGISTTSIWRLERMDQFPRRVRLGHHSVGWYRDEVVSWVQNRPRGLASSHLAARQTPSD
jgi:prophage regulatory protein